MFKFIKQIFVSTLMIFGSSSNVNPLECVSMKNQECKIRPEIVNISSNNPIFYPFSIKTSKCSGNCNNISDLYARIYVPYIVKSLILMSRTNETKHIKWHKTFNCICQLDGIFCNNKQYWNENKCRCECKKLIDKGVCDKQFIWNPSNCKCECDKSCDVGEYLDYKNCKCRQKLFDKLIEECTENINETSLVKKTLDKYEETKLVKKTLDKNENKHENNCSSCTVYIGLFSIIIAINIGFGIYFVYYKYKNPNKYDLPY